MYVKSFCQFINEVCDRSTAKLATYKDRLEEITIYKEDSGIFTNGYLFFTSFFDNLREADKYSSAVFYIMNNVFTSCKLDILKDSDSGEKVVIQRFKFLQYDFTENQISRCSKKEGNVDLYSVNDNIFNICTLILLGSYNQILKYEDNSIQYVLDNFKTLKPLQQKDIYERINKYMEVNQYE